MKKMCTVCKLEKELGQFSRNSKKAMGRHNMCKPCQKDYNAAYYLRTKDVHNPGRADRRRRMRDAAKAYVIAYLATHPCVDCGETDVVVLDFDHQADKVCDISDLIGLGAPIARIDQEIAKCEVVCANDHRRRTARTHGWVRALHPTAGSSAAELLTLNQ